MNRHPLAVAISFGIQQLLRAPRFVRVLTDEAQADRDEFVGKDFGGCTCFIRPPCSSCTHPGNPWNQDEDESCWELVRV